MLTDASGGVKPSSRERVALGYVAPGRHAALAFLAARPSAVRRLLVAGDVDEDVGRAARSIGLVSERVDRRDLDVLAGGVPHQGIAAVGEAPPGVALADVVRARQPLVLALDGLTDPRNVGAIFRSASAAGVQTVLLARDRAPALSPSLVKAAAGAVEWVDVARVTNLARALGELADAGYWVLGLDGDGETDLYDPAALPGAPVVLVAGSEGKGLRRLTQRVCHLLLRIPMDGPLESLNVSVAVALALFELRRRLPAGSGATAAG